MKKKLPFWALSAVCVLAFNSCENEDKEELAQGNTEEANPFCIVKLPEGPHSLFIGASDCLYPITLDSIGQPVVPQEGDQILKPFVSYAYNQELGSLSINLENFLMPCQGNHVMSVQLEGDTLLIDAYTWEEYIDMREIIPVENADCTCRFQLKSVVNNLQPKTYYIRPYGSNNPEDVKVLDLSESTEGSVYFESYE